MSQFTGSSSTSTEISFVYGDEDGDGDLFCVVSLTMADEKDEAHSAEEYCHINREEAYPVQHDVMKISSVMEGNKTCPAGTSTAHQRQPCCAFQGMLDSVAEFVHPPKDFENHVELVSFDEKGKFYHSEKHAVTLIIPEGAVQHPSTLQLASTELLVDFKCEEGSFQPVSPFLWIHTDAILSKPVKLYMPHYIDIDHENTKLVLLARGHEENAVFKVQNEVEVELSQTVALLSLSHFCVLCLTDAQNSNPAMQKIHVLVAEKNHPDGHQKKVDACILYTRHCHKRLREFYKKKGYSISIFHELKGSISPDGITIATDLAENQQWKVSEIGRNGMTVNRLTITMKDIDMYQYLECTPESLTEELIDELRDFENDGLYPQRFKLFFQNQSRRVVPLPVKMTLNGLVDGSVPKPHSITVILGSDHQQLGDNDPFILEVMPYVVNALIDNNTFFRFGRNLGLKIDKLQEIEDRFGCDMGKCVEKMLFHWIKAFPTSSYKEICAALSNIGYPVLSTLVNNHFLSTDQSDSDYAIVSIDVEKLPNDGYEVIREKLLLNNCSVEILQSEPTDIDLLKLVIPFAASNWKKFGAKVNLTRPALEVIEQQNIRNDYKCFEEVINTWRKNDSPPFTWERVLKVIYSQSIRGYRAGEEVYKHLLNRKSLK